MELNQVLNQQVSNWSILYIKLHNYHWFVKGENFFTLHEKFEELYTEAATYIDEIAERILSIGGKPLATMKDYLETSTIKEASGTETSQEMVDHLVSDFTTVIDELDSAMSIADQENDEATSDLLLGIQSSLQKHVWMLEAYLGKKVKQ
ncbi:general stress protein [Bacillus coahuilensis m2-6]|uniref:General stress protein n=1 Tax=Bacillus coahuilensis p1.1.43 TaxID=1150625 RepID=A0A147K7K1_9BACI|nr:DNA starvation/stationary phase protection protein [Bacillus coahuilensis]KUP06060.1 general stress protein [Bacillus coahuilensis p1.1.43]KUP07268.1 general stress protein [Bacillus coahuilensis m2-6]